MLTIAMAAKNDNFLSPEKQLLNMIEKPLSGSSLRGMASRHQRRSFFSLTALKARLDFVRDSFKKGRLIDWRRMDLGVLNGVLILGIALLAAYLAVSVVMSLGDLKKGSDLRIQVPPAAAVGPSRGISSLKEADYYVDKAKARDLFSMGMRKPKREEQKVSGPSPEMLDATKDLRLVGISWSDDPDAMVEDTRRQATFFVKRGQKLENGVTVKEIAKDRITLTYEGEDLELR